MSQASNQQEACGKKALFYTEDGGICSTETSVNCTTLHYILEGNYSSQLLQWEPQIQHNINFFPLARYGTIFSLFIYLPLIKHRLSPGPWFPYNYKTYRISGELIFKKYSFQ
jgi:hypothetical protein